MSKKRIAITGLGVVAPNGTNVDDFWAATRNGKSGIKAIKAFDTSEYNAKIAGVAEDFDDQSDLLAEVNAAGYDRYVQFAVAAAAEAVGMSKINFDQIDKTRFSVCIATAIAATKFLEEEFLRLTDQAVGEVDPERAQAALLPGLGFHVASSEVARRYGAEGSVSTLATGCTAGLDAIGEAMEMIRSGKADVVIAGATEAPITPIAMSAFDIIGALASDRNEAPETASRPYDSSRSGFVLSEGCGLFVLEDMDHALARNAPIYGELSGFGSTCNAYHMTDLKPEGTDLHRAMVLSLTDADVSPEVIGHVNAHGSSTPQNDVNESNAVKLTLGDHAYNIPVSSVKSVVGHALAAANTVELVSLIKSIGDQFVPPTINHNSADPNCDLDYVTNGSRPALITHALKDASGFSGIHSAVVVSRYIPEQTAA
ncbi:MAG: beta-ketoacyl-[acyl-carrier-protein] synthase family protein [Pseudomonadota bacterium]